MRCLALAEQWLARGGTVHVAAATMPQALARRMRKVGCHVHAIAAAPASAGDAKLLAKLAGAIGPTWGVVDGYHFGPVYQKAARAILGRLLQIDDHGRSGGHVADLVLDQNHGTSAGFYAGAGARTTLLAGPQYALLRQEFEEFREWTRPAPARPPRLLVTFGGGPPVSLVRLAVEALLPLPIEVAVVGDAPAGTSSRRTAAGVVAFTGPVTDMARRMAMSDLALTAGGSTVWELAFMGLPILAVAVADNQEPGLAALERDGLCISLGWHSDLTADALQSAAAALLADLPSAHERARRLRAIVDGRGAARVVDAMLEAS